MTLRWLGSPEVKQLHLSLCHIYKLYVRQTHLQFYPYAAFRSCTATSLLPLLLLLLLHLKCNRCGVIIIMLLFKAVLLQACLGSASKCGGTWKCWSCSLYSHATGPAWEDNIILSGSWWKHNHTTPYPLHVVVVWLLGLDPLQNGLVFVCHSQ